MRRDDGREGRRGGEKGMVRRRGEGRGGIISQIASICMWDGDVYVSVSVLLC
jgi:hypothetical protein